MGKVLLALRLIENFRYERSINVQAKAPPSRESERVGLEIRLTL